MLRNRFPEQCALKDPTVACPCTGRHLPKEMRTSRSSLSSGTHSPSFPTMYDGREALPDDHKFRGQRGRVRARYRRPQLGRRIEKIGETSQRKTNLQLASGAFSCKVAPFTPAGERTKKAPSRGGRTGSNGQQHPVVIDCEVLQKRRSRCTTPGELRANRRVLRPTQTT